MPVAFRIGQTVIAIQIMAVVIANNLYPTLITKEFDLGPANYVQLTICFAALVGLLRRVAWGRFFSSCFGVLAALSGSAFLIPDIDCSVDEPCRNPLLHIIGYEPSALLNWVVVVLVALFFLIPQVMVGWRKQYFRAKLW